MISDGVFISNSEEVEKAEALNMDIPEAEVQNLGVGFRMEEVKMYHHTSDGGLILYIGGYSPENSWKMQANDALVKALESKFNGTY